MVGDSRACSLELLSQYLLTGRRCLQMVVNLWEQVTFSRFYVRIKIREAGTSLAILEIKNTCPEF